MKKIHHANGAAVSKPPQSPQAARILIADDSEVCRGVLAILMRNAGHDVVCVENGRVAVEQLRQGSFDLAILDNDMPLLDGLGVLGELRECWPGLPVIVCSGTMSPELARSYRTKKVEDVFTKPVDPRRLREAVQSVLDREASQRPLHGRAASAGTVPPGGEAVANAEFAKPVFAGGSPAAAKLAADWHRIRDFRSAATVEGATGTACLEVAVAMAQSRDAVVLACPARELDLKNLSRLLGPALLHKRPVILIVADAEGLAPEQQDLLRQLFVSTSGPLSAFAGRVSLILCAAASLSDLADAGRFDEMLLMRAGAMKIRVPALSVRRPDLPAIARAVLKQVGAEKATFTPSAERWFAEQSWPGEYPQLHRTIELAKRLHGPGGVIDVPELEAAMTQEPACKEFLFHEVLLRSLNTPT